MTTCTCSAQPQVAVVRSQLPNDALRHAKQAAAAAVQGQSDTVKIAEVYKVRRACDCHLLRAHARGWCAHGRPS